MIKKGFRFLRALYKHNREYIRNEFSAYKNIKEQNFLTAYNDVHLLTSPVFVLSTGRCGTTLLTEILNHDVKMEVNHDRQPIFLHHNKIAYEKYAAEPEVVKMMADVGRFEMLLDVYLRGCKYVETNPYSTFFAFQLYELFPNSKFIHLVRHPGDFVRSAVSFDWFSGKNLYDIARLEPEDSEAFRKLGRVSQVGWLWNEYNGFIEKFKAQCAPERMLFVRSEEMFKNRSTLQQILNFCGARPFSDGELHKLLSKPVNEQTNFNLPKYKDWSQEQKQELRSIIAKELTDKYGYTL